ncbi:MAG: phospholipase D family protein [Methylococcales bacterium]|nr:phospholipase D family protein [Methylococcales bacterium]
MFLNEVDIRTSISELFSESEHVDCAVAFVGEKALELIPKNCKVRMICNLESGATNPHTIKALFENDVEIKTSEKLHAKVYIGDNSTIIGSANLSANGLGLEGDEITGWIEAGYKEETKDGQNKIRQWWLRHWENSKIITERDIEKYSKLWAVRRNSRSKIQSDQSLLSVLSSNPERIKDRRIFFVLYTENNLSDEAQNILDNAQKNESKYGVNVEAYEGWEELPENSYLIDFYVGPRGGVTYQGIYKTPEKKIIIKFPDRDGESETLFLCYKTEKINGYSVIASDFDNMKTAIKEMLKNKSIGIGNCGAKYIEIMDARSFIVKS